MTMGPCEPFASVFVQTVVFGWHTTFGSTATGDPEGDGDGDDAADAVGTEAADGGTDDAPAHHQTRQPYVSHSAFSSMTVHIMTSRPLQGGGPGPGHTPLGY